MIGSKCAYKDRYGIECQLEALENKLCYWHDPTIDKSQDDIKDQLEQLAKEGHTLCGFSLIRTQLAELNLVKRGDNQHYDMMDADFYRANLRGAHLFRLNLEHSSLMKANLKGANLNCSNLVDCNLLGTIFENAKFEHTKWGSEIQQQRKARESLQKSDQEAAIDYLEQAEEIYRNLRTECEHQGLFETAGDFFHREMVMRRLQLPRYSFHRMISKGVDLFSGYGEKPMRVILFSLMLIFCCGFAFFLLGIQGEEQIVGLSFNNDLYQNGIHFLECIYFSVITFTTLGYGDLVPIGPSRIMAAFEAFSGAFTLALFVVVFVKKMTR